MKVDHLFAVGITGASGSGKSYLAGELEQRLSSRFSTAVITEDCYYRKQCHLDMEQRALTNYDHPDSLEHDLLVRHLSELRKGRSIELPQYDYTQHTRRSETISIQPPALLLVEGILILSQNELRDQLDFKIFVDVPLGVCLSRRIERDTRERGRTRESIEQQFETTVRPMFKKFTEPTRAVADLVVPFQDSDSTAIDELADFLASKLNEKTRRIN